MQKLDFNIFHKEIFEISYEITLADTFRGSKKIKNKFRKIHQNS